MAYRSNRWKELMNTHSITPSMSRKANALDNACIESFFSFLKAERKKLKTVNDLEEAKQIIHEYIYYYNHKRIQGVLEYKTPTQYAKASWNYPIIFSSCHLDILFLESWKVVK